MLSHDGRVLREGVYPLLQHVGLYSIAPVSLCRGDESNLAAQRPFGPVRVDSGASATVQIVACAFSLPSVRILLDCATF